jgi:hypothetical protein
LFSKHLEALKRCWNNLSLPAKVDLGHALEYQSSLKTLGDDEDAFVARQILSSDDLVAGFESRIVELQSAVPTHYIEVDPSKKKDLKKNGISRTPLREFAYEMKLFWDDSMARRFGPNSAKVVPFSIATKIVVAAMKVLTEAYKDADFAWIMRDIQRSNYDRNEFQGGRVQGSAMIALLRPHLAEIQLSGPTKKYRLSSR